jgi:hypothetical protein
LCKEAVSVQRAGASISLFSPSANRGTMNSSESPWPLFTIGGTSGVGWQAGRSTTNTRHNKKISLDLLTAQPYQYNCQLQHFAYPFLVKALKVSLHLQELYYILPALFRIKRK